MRLRGVALLFSRLEHAESLVETIAIGLESGDIFAELFDAVVRVIATGAPDGRADQAEPRAE